MEFATAKQPWLIGKGQRGHSTLEVDSLPPRNSATFLESTNALAEMSEWVKPDWRNSVSLEFMQLRGWKKPFAPGDIKLSFAKSNESIEKRVAEGNLSVDWLSNFTEPEPGPQAAKFQALRLRLTASEPPSDEQQAQAAQLLAQVHADSVYVRATIVGLLGPLTGTPLTDVSSVTVDKSVSEVNNAGSTIQNSPTAAEQQP